MSARLFAIREHLRSSLWFIPTLALVLAWLLAESAYRLDRALIDADGRWFVFAGGPDAARSILGTIASSMITFTGLVFSVTMLVLQLASNQFSPRIMARYLRDRANQAVLGTFVATFAYALLTLRRVRSEGAGEFVPGLSVWVALLLTGICVLLFVYYIHHVAQSIRPVYVLRDVAAETLAAIDKVHGQPYGPDSLDTHEPERHAGRLIPVYHEGSSGIILHIDDGRLVELVRECDGQVRLEHAPGDFVPRKALLAAIWTASDGPSADAVRGNIAIGPERTLQQDPPFGFRQLVDIAERALSPGINDPTTAVQALDYLHDLLIVLGERDLPAMHVFPSADEPRVLVPGMTWDRYVHLALDEVRQYGRDSLQVHQRIRLVLDDLEDRIPEARRVVIRAQRDLLEAALTSAFTAPAERDEARQAGHR